METSDIREYGNLNHWGIIASGNSPLVPLILKWRPLLYVPKHHHIHQHSPYDFVLCGCLVTKLSINYLLNYIFTCWSFPLSNEIHKNKHYVCLDHYCISCSWYSAGYVTSWRKCPTHSLIIQHCCVCLPACQASTPYVWAEEALLKESYRCQAMNAPRSSRRQGLWGSRDKYYSSSLASYVGELWGVRPTAGLHSSDLSTKLLDKASFIGCLPFSSHSLPDVSWAPLPIKPLTVRSLARGQLPEEPKLRWSLLTRWLLSQLLICFIKQVIISLSLYPCPPLPRLLCKMPSLLHQVVAWLQGYKVHEEPAWTVLCLVPCPSKELGHSRGRVKCLEKDFLIAYLDLKNPKSALVIPEVGPYPEGKHSAFNER